MTERKNTKLHETAKRLARAQARQAVAERRRLAVARERGRQLIAKIRQEQQP